jgi:hypothetical protein
VPPQSLIPARVKRPKRRQCSALFQAGCYLEKQREFELTSLGLLFSHLPGDPTKWTTPFLNAIETTDSFSLRFITDTNENKLPLHASLIATIPAKDGGLGYRHPQRAALLGAFAVPIARTIKYALQGLQIGSDPDIPTTLAADHRYAFETLTTHTAPTNPWKHIDSIARIINTQITRNETDTPHADISKGQTQRRCSRPVLQ